MNEDIERKLLTADRLGKIVAFQRVADWLDFNAFQATVPRCRKYVAGEIEKLWAEHADAKRDGLKRAE